MIKVQTLENFGCCDWIVSNCQFESSVLHIYSIQYASYTTVHIDVS